ncbi:MAG: aldo/keto reductase [Candidatus Hydrogenedentota bacterium]
MLRFQLAPNGPSVSTIAYGLWRLTDDPAGPVTSQVRAKIDACLECGITTFDNADVYGGYTCEGLFGRALAEAPELRDRMELVTKCGVRSPKAAMPEIGVAHYDATAARIKQCVDRSLSELRVDHIDLLLIHRPDWLTSAEDTAEGLLDVMACGKVRSVGVSNYTVHQFALLQKFLGFAPSTNQVELSLVHMDPIYEGTLDQCQAAGVHPMAWSPLGRGRLFTDESPDGVRLRAKLRELALEYGCDADQLALAWVKDLPSRPQVVIGTLKLDRIRRAATSADIHLAREHWYALWEAAKGKQVP